MNTQSIGKMTFVSHGTITTHTTATRTTKKTRKGKGKAESNKGKDKAEDRAPLPQGFDDGGCHEEVAMTKKAQHKWVALYDMPLTHARFGGMVHPGEMPKPELKARKVYQGICYNCGELGHLGKECKAPAPDKMCFKCEKMGHIEMNCPQTVCCWCHKRQPGHASQDCDVLADDDWHHINDTWGTG